MSAEGSPSEMYLDDTPAQDEAVPLDVSRGEQHDALPPHSGIPERLGTIVMVRPGMPPIVRG